MSENKKIRALFIIEVLGRPPQYLTETLNEILIKISSEPGVIIREKKINEPAPVKDQKDLYTNFMEVEVEVDSLIKLAGLMFRYMPAHVDIISPENLNIKNYDLSSFFTEITRRLHVYDEVARRLELEKLMLDKKLREVLGNSTVNLKNKEDNSEKSKKKKGKNN